MSSPAATPALCALFAFLSPSPTSCRQNYMQLLLRFRAFRAPSSQSPRSLDDSQITQENRETAETELAKARGRVRTDEKGLLMPCSSFSRRRSTGLDLCSNRSVADMLMWRRQLFFVLAAAVFGWTLVSGEELDDANKKGRSKFSNFIRFLSTYQRDGSSFSVNLFQIVT